jgi:hypothetical protein
MVPSATLAVDSKRLKVRQPFLWQLAQSSGGGNENGVRVITLTP